MDVTVPRKKLRTARLDVLNDKKSFKHEHLPCSGVAICYLMSSRVKLVTKAGAWFI